MITEPGGETGTTENGSVVGDLVETNRRNRKDGDWNRVVEPDGGD